jgi:F420-0:gamma-glutamyl ligase
LIAAQDGLIEALERLIKVEREISFKLKEINKLSSAQGTQLNNALEAKDKQIEALEEANKILRREQRAGFWRTVRNGIVTAAAGILLGKIF